MLTFLKKFEKVFLKLTLALNMQIYCTIPDHTKPNLSSIFLPSLFLFKLHILFLTCSELQTIHNLWDNFFSCVMLSTKLPLLHMQIYYTVEINPSYKIQRMWWYIKTVSKLLWTFKNLQNYNLAKIVYI